MNRRLIVVGDPLVNGGRVLPYTGPEFKIHGHQVALIGGRAYCESCNSVGLIAKTGGPRRGFLRDAEMALDGDVVVCQCPHHQPVKSALTNAGEYDDTDYGFRGLTAAPVLANYGSVFSPPMAAAKKVVDEHFEHAPEHEPTLEAICPNMTNKEFCNLMLDLRDKAVTLISKKRLPELERWGKTDQARVKDWFGIADQSMREHLQHGLSACERVLRELDCKNFVRLTPDGKTLSCIVPSYGETTVAMVCKPDTSTHTIAFNTSFCRLRDTSAGVDSKLSSLIHEVTHFEDTFGSSDSIYYLRESRKAVELDQVKVKSNADSIAGYVVWDEVFHA